MGGFGYELYDIGDLFKWGSCMWIFGLLVGIVLLLFIFDGGVCSVGVKQVCVVYEENVVNYCESVFVVFCEVEDNFLELCLLVDQVKVQDDVVCVFMCVVQLFCMCYNVGLVNYLDVIDVECNMLFVECIGV